MRVLCAAASSALAVSSRASALVLFAKASPRLPLRSPDGELRKALSNLPQTSVATRSPTLFIVFWSCACAVALESVFWSMDACSLAASAPDSVTSLFCWEAATPCEAITMPETPAERSPVPMPTHMPICAARCCWSAWSWIDFCTARFSDVLISRVALRWVCATSIISAMRA